MENEAIIEITRRWVSQIVIVLNLCPFARRVFDADLIRYVVTDAADEEALLEDLARELKDLATSRRPSVETTLLIHPHALPDFLDYNDFLEATDRLIRDLGLSGIIQIASFHPGYQFAGTAPDAVENYTNRSPYQMLHLLREESISKVADDPEALLGIPERNIEMLRGLGRNAILAKLKAVTES